MLYYWTLNLDMLHAHLFTDYHHLFICNKTKSIYSLLGSDRPKLHKFTAVA